MYLLVITRRFIFSIMNIKLVHYSVGPRFCIAFPMKFEKGFDEFSNGMLERLTCLMNPTHYADVTMGAMASQITSLTIVYSTVYSDADQRKHQGSASLAFVWGIHR